MSFMDKLRKKAEELDLETKARQLQEAATTAAKQAQQKAGEFTTENREKIDGYVDAASTKIDEKTHGKYHDQVSKVRSGVDRGIDKVAEGGTPAAGATGAAAAGGVTEAGPFPVDPAAPRSTPPVETAAAVPDPTLDAMADSALEDTVLGLDTPPATEPGNDPTSTPGSTPASEPIRDASDPRGGSAT